MVFTKEFWNNRREELVKKISEGNRLRHYSDEARKHISESHKGLLSPMTGHHHTEEAKKKISESNKGRISPMKGQIFSDIHRKRLSESRKGMKFSEEHCRKIGEKHRGLKRTEEVKQKMRKPKSDIAKEKIRLGMLKYIKAVCGDIRPNLGHNEKQILDKLENELNYRILRQYQIAGYFLDGYIPEINLAIEVDERTKDTERDIRRQKEIENKLGCTFMRINDFGGLIK